MDKAEARRFVEKYITNQHTVEEHQAFHQWLQSMPSDEKKELLDEYANLLQQSEKHFPADPILLERIEEYIEEGTPKQIHAQPRYITSSPSLKSVPSLKRRFLYTAAAVIALLVVSGVYWMSTLKRPDAPAITGTSEHIQDIPPGGNKAVLTLADGSKISLNEVSGGTLAMQGETKVVKLHSGELAYQPESSTTSPDPGDLLYNTIETPRGGQYQLTLPDGTKVWLNAASSLRYPISFKGPDRTVFLTGEAYFEVASSPATISSSDKTAKKPFHVRVNDMTVTVLGTHFNIMAYAGKSQIETTLLEGSVQVNAKTTNTDPVQLYPGQQAILDKNNAGINVAEVNTEEIVAWQKGYFQFNRANIYAIMRQVERWYDVKVVYEEPMPKEEFIGKISRNESLSSVLRIFKLSKINFRIEGNKIIVFR
ncbi:MAG TPA: FecR domain-containing protein [Anseongella sp.]